MAPVKPTTRMSRETLDALARSEGIDPGPIRNKAALVDAILNRRDARDVLRNLTLNARAFIGAFSQSGNITAAAEAVGVSRQSHYDWLAADDVRSGFDMADPGTEPGPYRTAFLAAEEEAADRLEMEARRRGSEGWLEPVYQGGAMVGTKRKYSDRLLMALLEAHHPKFGRKVRVTHDGGMTLDVRDAREALKQKVEQAIAYRGKHGGS